MGTMGARGSIPERFWNKVEWTNTGDCWIWIGSRHNHGYGRFYVSPERGTMPAHAFARELVLGDRVPAGLHALHHCDVPQCVNPDHIYFGTPKDNASDRTVRGRGESCVHLKLSFQDVCAIREATGRQADIAARFGISRSYVSNLRNPRKRPRRMSR